MTVPHRPGFPAVCLLGAALLLFAGCASGGRGGAGEPLPSEIEAELSEAEAQADSLPAAVGRDYTVGPDDLLDIRVLGAPDLSGEARVTSSGDVSLPLVGRVPAGGLTPRELEESLEDALRGTYMWDPQVTVQVLEARSHAVSRVYVLGGVRRPGGFPLERGEPVSVVQALALAEGLEPTAAKGRAKIIREGAAGQREEVPVDLDRILDGSANDPLLGHRDILFVPNSGARSALRGAWQAFIRIFTFRGLL